MTKTNWIKLQPVGIYGRFAMEKSDETDVCGDMYGHLLNKIARSGLNEHFRTLSQIVKSIIEMMSLTPDDVICKIKTCYFIQRNAA